MRTPNKNKSLERQIGCYLRPRVFMMFVADTKIKMRSLSGHADDIISRHYEALPLKHQQELIDHYKKINESN